MLPRRPWIHQPGYKQVDRLLEREIPGPFGRRMLPNEFGAQMHQQGVDVGQAELEMTRSDSGPAGGSVTDEIDYEYVRQHAQVGL